MADIQLQDILADLKKTGHRIAVVVRTRDGVFPVEKMRQVLDPDMIDCFIETDGSHTSLRTDAQVREHVVAVCQALEAMEKKNPAA